MHILLLQRQNWKAFHNPKLIPWSIQGLYSQPKKNYDQKRLKIQWIFNTDWPSTKITNTIGDLTLPVYVIGEKRHRTHINEDIAALIQEQTGVTICWKQWNRQLNHNMDTWREDHQKRGKEGNGHFHPTSKGSLNRTPLKLMVTSAQ